MYYKEKNKLYNVLYINKCIIHFTSHKQCIIQSMAYLEEKLRRSTFKRHKGRRKLIRWDQDMVQSMLVLTFAYILFRCVNTRGQMIRIAKNVDLFL